MMGQQKSDVSLNFIEPLSQSDYYLLDEVATSEDLDSILVMLLLDDTLSDSLRRKVNKQLKTTRNITAI
ncbi:hypothetical protein PSECIP111951_04012 [Pseudoalteromonas holothuriae]|uniref:Uncharacterized protein n=1 Tax=Pseudoalteromonas holothuriae TaxID=2963714 RepID=A0A9W4VXW3_9GAMM|nr:MULTISPECIES: hypothetical protein [unclassified Pseudoalteromonas]CAH9062602.1 hypothetical protein PSECIP111854_03046 [Pseudoalteromonas sp. CIP111854]CAH9068091.1 hypothetical protein PSECIP111951_04012 [Pseudoalteromonas sp. CIP111951]